MQVTGHEAALHRGAPGLLSKYGALLDVLLRIGDVAIVVAAGMAMHRLRFHLPVQVPYAPHLVRAALLTLLIFPACGVYGGWRGAGLRSELARIALAWGLVSIALILIEWALKTTEDYSRLWTAGWFAAGLMGLAGARLLERGALGLIRAHGIDTRRVVLVGATPAGARLLHATRDNPRLGLDVVGYVSTHYDNLPDPAASTGLDCLGNFDSFLATLRSDPPDAIWVALPLRAEDLIQRLLEATADMATTVKLVPDMFGFELINHAAGNIGGVPVIALRASRITGHARLVKAIEDRVLASLFLLLLTPLMLLLALGVKLSSPGPVFYRQRRVGLDGKEFDMLKFRSMPVDVEKDGVRWGNARNKQTTRFGRFLRASSLDELPQFINVLKGDLSIVGPRPERPMFVEEFRKSIPGYMHKHLVKGGITGWAQINGWRGDTDITKRVECDLQYIQTWSIWMDLRIIALTPLAIIRSPAS